MAVCVQLSEDTKKQLPLLLFVGVVSIAIIAMIIVAATHFGALPVVAVGAKSGLHLLGLYAHTPLTGKIAAAASKVSPIKNLLFSLLGH